MDSKTGSMTLFFIGLERVTEFYLFWPIIENTLTQKGACSTTVLRKLHGAAFFTGFYRVFLGLLGFYPVEPCCADFDFDSHRIWPDFTEFSRFYRIFLFYRVLPSSFFEFYLVFYRVYLLLLSITEFYWVLPSFYLLLPIITECYPVLLGFYRVEVLFSGITEFYWVFTELNCLLPSLVELLRVFPSFNGFSNALPNFT